MKRFIDWLAAKFAPRKTALRRDLTQTGSLPSTARPAAQQRIRHAKPALPRRQPEYVNLDLGRDGEIEDNGPGKNVLIRNKYIREDTGTHETLMILDDSIIETDEETGIDPYNTGQFDRSRNWDKRFRKS